MKFVKYFLFLLMFLIIYSCGKDEAKKIKKSPEFENLYNKKLNELKKNPQFLIDNLELLYLKKGVYNNEANLLIEKIPKKYKRIIAVFKLVFSIEEPKEIPLDRRFLSVLLKFQDNQKVLDFIAKNYYKAKDNSSIRAFYTLYALNYNFTEEDYENYLKVDSLSKFIKLNFILQKLDYCKDNSCSENINDKEKFLNFLKKELYQSETRNYKKIKKLYKDSLTLIKRLKKEVKKIARRNKKLKRRRRLKGKYEEELSNKIDVLNFYKKELIPKFKLYLYFYGRQKRFPRKIDKLIVVENFLINNTKPNKKIFYFIFNNIKYKHFSYRINFYRYLKKIKLKLSKREFKKLESLRYSKGYDLLKYGYYKRYFPKLFKKLNVKKYLDVNFIYIIVKDFDWYFLEILRKNPKNVKNLSYFQYYPGLIIAQKDKLFTLYTKDKLGHYKISGNESLIYNLLKILLKADVKLTKEQIDTLEPIKVIYIKEILKFFL